MRIVKIISIRIFVLCFLLIGLLFCQYDSVLAKGDKTHNGKSNKQIIVKYKNKSKNTDNKVKEFKTLKNGNEIKYKVNKKLNNDKAEVWELDESEDVDTLINELKQDSEIEYVQPDYQLSISTAEGERDRFAEQWALSNTGQEFGLQNGRQGVDINALNAWNLTQGSENVLIGVLDTGIDINHPSLKNRIYGGWDFANDDDTIYDSKDEDSHGTLIAGIIAANGQVQGIKGVAPNVKLVSLKFMKGNYGYTSDAIEAIEYAKSMGIKIINCSFGSSSYNYALKDAMENSDILFVCSVGNTGSNLSNSPIYPACFDLPNIISVASIDYEGRLTSFSNYGEEADVAAPGLCVWTTAPGERIYSVKGTSVSAAFVTGTAGLIKSYSSGATFQEIISRIKNNVVESALLVGKVSTKGRVDAYAALTNVKPDSDQYTLMNQGDDFVVSGSENKAENDLLSDGVFAMVDDLTLEVNEQMHYGEFGVNPGTGNFSFTYNAMEANTQGLDIPVSVTYNSKEGWDINYDGYIVLRSYFSSSGFRLYKINYPDGSIEFFKEYNDGKLEMYHTRTVVTKDINGIYYFTKRNGNTYVFENKGHGTQYRSLTKIIDKKGNAISIDIQTGGLRTGFSDAAGKHYTINYTNGKLTSIIEDSSGRTASFLYNPEGRLSSMVDPMGKTTGFTYTANGENEKEMKQLSSIIDDDGITSLALTYFPATDRYEREYNVKTITDSLGNTYTYTDYWRTSLDWVHTYVTDSQGNNWHYFSDAEGYVWEYELPEGIKKYNYYDMYGLSPQYNKFGDLTHSVDENGNVTQYLERDDWGNATKIINPDGSVKEYDFDSNNNLIMEKDEVGIFTFYVYDAQKINLLRKVQVDSTNALYIKGESPIYTDSAAIITQYSYYTEQESTNLGYNIKNLLKSITDPEGNVTTYTYYPDGQIKTISDPETNKITTYEYNYFGYKTKETTPKGYVTNYYYDNNGLLEKTVFNGGETLRNTYNYMGQKVQEILPNQYNLAMDDLANHEYNGDEGNTYEYYSSGKVKRIIDSEGNETSYTYDVRGNVKTETKPNQSIYEYEYDGVNRLKKVYYKADSNSANTLVEEYSYSIVEGDILKIPVELPYDDGMVSVLKNPQKIQKIYFNGSESATTVFTYNYADKMLNQQNPDGSNISYVYNPDQTVNSSTDANNNTTYFLYDILKNVTEQWTPYTKVDGIIKYVYSKTEYFKNGLKKAEILSEYPVELYQKAIQIPTDIEQQDYEFDTLNARYIRVNTTKLSTDEDSNNALQLGELRVYNDEHSIVNLPVASITASTTHSSYSVSNLIDNNSETVWSSALSYISNSNQYITLDLGSIFKINQINLMPDVQGQYFPADFQLLYSVDGTNFLEIPEQHYGNYATPINGATQNFEFEAIDTRYIRVNAVKLTRISGSSYYYFRLREITVWHYRYNNTSTYTKAAPTKIINGFPYVPDTYQITSIPATSVAASSSMSGYPVTNLIDNNINTCWISGKSSSSTTTAYVTFDMGSIKQINQVSLIPESQGSSFPIDFMIQYSTDGTTFTTIPGEYHINYPNPSDGSIQVFIFDMISTRYIRIYASKLVYINQNYYVLCQFAEMGVSKKDVIYKPAVSSQITGNSANNLFDDNDNTYWSSEYHATPNYNENITYDLGKIMPVNKIGMVPRINGYGFPKAFNIEYSVDGVNFHSIPGQDYITVDLITKSYEYYKNGKLKSVIDNEGRKICYQYDDDGVLSREEKYYNNTSANVTEYVNNYFGKPDIKRVYINSGEIVDSAGNVISTPYLEISYTYDKNGNLKTTTDSKNVITTIGYDTLNRQTTIEQPGFDENDLAVTIKTETRYNWEGKPLYTIDANNNKTNYVYNQRGLLIYTINPLDGVTLYGYDLAGRKIFEVSPKNYTGTMSASNIDNAYTIYATDLINKDNMSRTEFKYDDLNRLTYKYDKYLDPETNTFKTITNSYIYDNNGNRLSETDGIGYVTTYTYDLANRVITKRDADTKKRDGELPESSATLHTFTYEYDALGRKTKETNANNVSTVYQYDVMGNVLSKTLVASGEEDKLLQSNTYDYLGNLLTQTDGNGNTTTYQYNSLGKLKSVIKPGDESIPSVTYTMFYDVNGNLAKKSDTTDVVELYTFDNQNRQITSTKKKSDGSQVITTSVKYDKNGNKRFEFDGNGNQIETQYDGLNRKTAQIIKTKNYDKSVTTTHTTTYGYDKNNNLTTETDWKNCTIIKEYDPLNRLIWVKDQNNIVIQKLLYNNNHVQIKSYDALNNATTFDYDKNNRLLATMDPLYNSNVDQYTHKTSQTYDVVGNIETKTDGRGNITTYGYDSLNRLVSVKNTVNGVVETTSYAYDTNGNMLAQTNGEGHVTTFEYNVANKIVKKIDHDGINQDGTIKPEKTESYTYDGRGNMLTKTDRNGDTTTYTYDVHNRMLTLSGKDVSIVQTYDGNGNKLTMTDESGETVRTYDELNRVLSKSTPGIGTTIYTYDITGNIPAGYSAEKAVDPKNNVTIKIYDKVGRIKEVKDSESADSAVYEYYDNGSVKSVAYPDGTSGNYTYYDDNQLETLINKNSSGIAIDTYTYTYDGAHNQDSKTEIINGVPKGTTNYTYDELNRLKTVTEPSNKLTSYEYDKAGNRKIETVTANGQTTTTVYNYNEQERLITTVATIGDTVTTTTYHYDNNGNLYSKSFEKTEPDAQAEEQVIIVNQGTALDENGVAIYEYNVLNQLVKATDGNSITENVYNGEGLRTGTTKITGGMGSTGSKTTLHYLYEYDKVVLEVDESGNEVARNVYGTNLISREVDKGKPTNQKLTYLYNGHADVTALTDTSGNIVASYYYDSWGNILEQTGNANNPFKYSGYVHDNETGLYYLNSRFYDPVTSRFMQEDTYRGQANDPLSLNLYTYVLNNPNKYYDPTGHGPDEDLLKQLMNDPAALKKYVDEQGGINRKMPANVYQMLYGAMSGPPAGKPTGPENRYGDYGFGVLDALNWLIQTGGDVNFVLQMRDVQNLTDSAGNFDSWLAKDMSAEWQANMIGMFTTAGGILNGLNDTNYSVNTPSFYLGAVEGRPDTLLNMGGRTGIYDQVVSRVGNSMITGAYYGEDFIDQSTATSVSTFMHEERGKSLLWIPYYHLGEGGLDAYFNRVSNIANMTHGCAWGSRPLFDTILLQPGTFYFNGGLNRDDIFGLTDKINGWNRSRGGNSTVMGLQFEFDMGLVTGRDDPGYSLRNYEKKSRLNDYFSAITHLSSGTPLGIYSGGPNEHAYANPRMNANRHNTGNHRVQDSWESFSYMNGTPYNAFSGTSYGGNLIYDINNYLFRGQWNNNLTNFGLQIPR